MVAFPVAPVHEVDTRKSNAEREQIREILQKRNIERSVWQKWRGTILSMGGGQKLGVAVDEDGDEQDSASDECSIVQIIEGSVLNRMTLSS
jgi:hypothetical protein